MTITYARAAATVLLGSTLMSAGYQVHRALLGVNPAVDRFDLDAVVGYVVLAAAGLALWTDRRLAWWAAALLSTGLLTYAVVGYYPMIHAARPMVLLDWLEGTLFTGALLLVLGLAVLRLGGVALTPGRVRPADGR